MTETARADFFRARALEVRRLADQCVDDIVKQQMQMIAAEYETLALKVEDGTFAS